ncbi:MAG TPA: carboxypeptidase-like regulatory domain-containing protein [Vicinamibacterales bacterium]|jgi:hypothetical protein|nr:carboxypeptidase-like regulatory domain-containing protein [Vicinamibacterales bacterium]
MTSTLRVVILAWLALAVFAQPDTGAIAGRVTDESGGVLPGVKVTVLAASVAKEIVTGADGRFLIPGLPVGTYRVRAELAGYRPAMLENLVVKRGATTDVRVPMRVGILSGSLMVLPADGVAGAMREAVEVLHVRVRSLIGSGPLGKGANIIGTEHEAVVLETIKAGATARAPNTFVKFWQHDAGRVVEDGRNYLGRFRVIAPGEPVIVLLRSSPSEGLTTYADDRYLFSTAKGVVTAFAIQDPRIPDGTPVDKAIATLRELVKAGDR